MKINKILFTAFISITITTLPGFAKDANILTSNEAHSISGYPLSIDEAIQHSIANNFDIEIARLERKIIAHEIPASEAIYDTSLTASFGYTVDEEEKSSSILAQKSNLTEWNVGLQKKFSWGSLVALDFLNFRNSAASPFASLNPYYSADTRISVTQPIMKNAFGLIDRYGIRFVKLDVSRLDLGLLNRIEENIAQVERDYWELFFAHGNLKNKQEALEFANEFLEITQKQFDDGALEETDLYAAKANIEQRQRETLEAQQVIANTSDNLKLSMNYFPAYTFSTSTTPNIVDIENHETSIATALENRRDLKAAEISIQQNNLSLVMNKNARWPQLDLIATFTSNGLAREMIDAVGEEASFDDPTYFIGAEFSIPLENRKANSAFKQTELEKAKSLIAIKRIEKQIMTDIQIAVRTIELRKQQIMHNKKIIEDQQKKLEGEQKKYSFGRSSSDVILRYEDDVLNAQTAYILSLADYSRAIVNLKRNQNVLLDDVKWITYEAQRK